MAIKLIGKERPAFIPNVTFIDENDLPVDNRKLPEDEQVKVRLTLADTDQRTQYLGSYTTGTAKQRVSGDAKTFTSFQYKKAVRTHVTEITGLEEYKITDGKSLVNFPVSPELNALIEDCFYKICGIHSDDLPDNNEEITESGDFSEKE